MENQEIIKQMLDRIDLLVRQNSDLARQHDADKATIESLTTEVTTLRTAIKQFNGERAKMNADAKAKETIEKTLAKNAKENFASIFGIDLDAIRGEADFLEQVRAAVDTIRQAKEQTSPVLSPAFVEKTLLGLRDTLPNMPGCIVIVGKK
jgi:polynucleotide 5'-kinase involved in rRNA processing